MDKIKCFLDSILNESTPEHPVWNQEAVLENKSPAWSYIDGCMAIAVLYMYQVTGEKAYNDFLKNFIDYYIDEDGIILGYDFDSMNSDSINEGKVLFHLYETTGEKRYRKAIERLYEQIKNQPRTESGSFWHKKIYPNQVWLDGLYMVQPFYLQYELTFNQGRNIPDIMQQFANVDEHMKDEETGLLFHGYDETHTAFWSNQSSGCSSSFWTRSIGWYAMALVDSLDILREDYPEESETLLIYLNELMESLLTYEDIESHLFHQVTDQGKRIGNYLETSGTSAIAYTLMKGARLGVLPEKYFNKGQEILSAIVNQKLVEQEGTLILKDICLVAGLGGMPGKGNYKLRDGSYEYYISEPIVLNDAKGIAPLIYAYSEYLQYHR